MQNKSLHNAMIQGKNNYHIPQNRQPIIPQKEGIPQNNLQHDIFPGKNDHHTPQSWWPMISKQKIIK